MTNYNGGRSLTGWIVGLVAALVIVVGVVALLGNEQDQTIRRETSTTEQSPPASQTPPANRAPATQSPGAQSGGTAQ